MPATTIYGVDQDGNEIGFATWEGAGFLIWFDEGGAGLHFVTGWEDPEIIVGLDLRLWMYSIYAPGSGTLSVYRVDEPEPAPFSTARRPSILPKVLVASQAISVSPPTPGPDEVTISLGPAALPVGWTGTLGLILTYAPAAGGPAILASSEAGQGASVAIASWTQEELEGMAAHARRQALDRVLAALRASAAVPDPAIVEDDPALLTMDEILPGGLVTVFPVEEDSERVAGPTMEETDSRHRRLLTVAVSILARDPIERDALSVDVEKAMAGSGIAPSAPVREIDLRRAVFDSRRDGERKLYALQLRYALEYHVLDITPDEPIGPTG